MNGLDGLFRELFGRGYHTLCRDAGAGIGPELRRHLDPDDIVQDAFLKAFQLMDRADPGDQAGMLVWLRRIVEHRLQERVRFWRTRKRSGAEEPAPSEDPSDARGADERPRADLLADRELLAALFGVVGRLPSDHRDVIVLREFFDVSWTEVASILDRPTIGAAQQLHQRARAELRRSRGTAAP